LQDLDERRIEQWFEKCLAPPESIPEPPAHCKAEVRS
jgi:hypothetical protein